MLNCETKLRMHQYIKKENPCFSYFIAVGEKTAQKIAIYFYNKKKQILFYGFISVGFALKFNPVVLNEIFLLFEKKNWEIYDAASKRNAEAK